MSLRVLGPLSTTGPELVVAVPAARAWVLQSLAGTLEGEDGMGRRTLILRMLSAADAGNTLFNCVLFDGNGPLSEIIFAAAVGWPIHQRVDVGQPYITTPLPNITLPADAVLKFDTGGVAINELFILVDEL